MKTILASGENESYSMQQCDFVRCRWHVATQGDGVRPEQSVLPETRYTSYFFLMPILPREPDLFPLDLFEVDAGTREGAWWAMYTMSRREKELMRFLRNADIPFYGPLVARKSRSPAGRVRTSHVPLFPGYVFVHATSDQRGCALTSKCISKTLEISDTDLILNDLRQIWRLVESHAPLTQESRIAPGQLVRVISGPFMGVEGTVLSRRGEERLIVSVRFLQQGVSVAIEDYQVEPL